MGSTLMNSWTLSTSQTSSLKATTAGLRDLTNAFTMELGDIKSNGENQVTQWNIGMFRRWKGCVNSTLLSNLTFRFIGIGMKLPWRLKMNAGFLHVCPPELCEDRRVGFHWRKWGPVSDFIKSLTNVFLDGPTLTHLSLYRHLPVNGHWVLVSIAPGTSWGGRHAGFHPVDSQHWGSGRQQSHRTQRGSTQAL